VLGILRGLEAREVATLVTAVQASGLRFLEVTMNTEEAELRIAELRAALPEVTIGAGTVLSLGDLDRAISAGARFVVSPVCVPEVVAAARERGLAVLPGALTPQEIHQAYARGATLVKVFPVGCLGGVRYMKELRGPFGKLPLLACGGITPENAGQYLAAGADAVAIGSGTFRREWLKEGQSAELAAAIRAVMEATQKLP